MPEVADHPQCAVAADGGTIAIWFTDSCGTTQNLFLDRRIRTTTRDHLYRKAHPGSPETEYIGYSVEAVGMFEEIIGTASNGAEPAR